MSTLTRDKEKRRISVASVVIVVLALVIAVGSVTFLSPCIHEDGSAGSCTWAGRMMTGLGALALMEAVLALLQRRSAARAGLLLATGCTAVLGILTPGILIPLCKMSTMRCRAIMQPAMIILWAAILLTALIGWLRERKN